MLFQEIMHVEHGSVFQGAGKQYLLLGLRSFNGSDFCPAILNLRLGIIVNHFIQIFLKPYWRLYHSRLIHVGLRSRYIWREWCRCPYTHFEYFRAINSCNSLCKRLFTTYNALGIAAEHLIYFNFIFIRLLKSRLINDLWLHQLMLFIKLNPFHCCFWAVKTFDFRFLVPFMLCPTNFNYAIVCKVLRGANSIMKLRLMVCSTCRSVEARYRLWLVDASCCFVPSLLNLMKQMPRVGGSWLKRSTDGLLRTIFSDAIYLCFYFLFDWGLIFKTADLLIDGHAAAIAGVSHNIPSISV